MRETIIMVICLLLLVGLVIYFQTPSPEMSEEEMLFAQSFVEQSTHYQAGGYDLQFERFRVSRTCNYYYFSYVVSHNTSVQNSTDHQVLIGVVDDEVIIAMLDETIDLLTYDDVEEPHLRNMYPGCPYTQAYIKAGGN